MNKTKALEEQLYLVGWIFLAVGAAGMFLYLQLIMPNVVLPPCMFYTILGFYCPGCGGTRAVQALLAGNLLRSLWYHPLVLYTVIVFGGFMLTHTLAHMRIKCIKGWKFHNWYLYGAVGIVLVNWVLKNILLLFDYKL